MDDLVERAEYTHEHGIFTAVTEGKYVTYAELAAEIRSLRAQVAQVAQVRAGKAQLIRVLEEADIRLCDHGFDENSYMREMIADAIEAQQDKEPQT